MSQERCFICAADEWTVATADYLRCSNCGHEVLVAGQHQQFMVNDALERTSSGPSILVRYQSALLQKVTRSRRVLLDVGSGSGHFLAHNRGGFSRVVGIEVSDRSLDYARTRLGLEVHTEMPNVLETLSVVTFWHSLEHMPVASLRKTLARIEALSDRGTQVIVAVPNSRSFQYAWLGEKYAFYDAPNHLHQFSPRSLDLLMAQHGFSRRQVFLSLPYVWFGWVQGFANLLTPIRNYWYYRCKRGCDFGLSSARLARLDAFAWLAMCLAVPIGSLCSLLDLASSKRRGTLTVCYAKTD